MKEHDGWEVVWGSADLISHLKRMKVPGGWIYSGNNGIKAGKFTFVPDPDFWTNRIVDIMEGIKEKA